MSILETYPALVTALSQEMTPKFLATRSADGLPNVVPCTSIMPAGDRPDRLILGNFLLRKSVANLDADPRLGILVITTDLEGWVLQADFAGWQRTGDYVDKLNNTDLLRYNAYTGIRNAGIVEVRALLRHFRIPRLRVLADYLLARAAHLAGFPDAPPEPAVEMPPIVRQKFSPMTAVRVLAFLDDHGYPRVEPLLSLQPAGKQALVCAGAPDVIPAGTPVAANLLTLDVVSFQAKGRWLGSRRFLGAPVGGMSVTAVYAGGPPIPGRQVA
ncbi:MAG: pyridoxamine 5'-phosphate oxidase family protein [Anaerolineae bacterium]|jgi:hypothetical protein